MTKKTKYLDDYNKNLPYSSFSKEWSDIANTYMKYQSDCITGKIKLDSSLELWVFTWLDKNYNPPISKNDVQK